MLREMQCRHFQPEDLGIKVGVNMGQWHGQRSYGLRRPCVLGRYADIIKIPSPHSFEVPWSGRRMQEESPLMVNRPQVDKIGVQSLNSTPETYCLGVCAVLFSRATLVCCNTAFADVAGGLWVCLWHVSPLSIEQSQHLGLWIFWIRN